tara:strand:- start:300 stop:545 length:246 start_codon:yes stop_codon:yes gene_type:complete
MKPTNTITVKVQNIRFDVSIDGDDPQEPYMDGVWLVGSVQELSSVLDVYVFDEIEQAALQEIADRQYDSQIEAYMEECTGS